VAEGIIEAMTLRDMLERGERVTVVDVRKGEDYNEWSIPGSVNFDAYDALHADDERAMEGLELPEGAPVVTAGTLARWLRNSCGVRGTRRSLWTVGWGPGASRGTRLRCPCPAPGPRWFSCVAPVRGDSPTSSGPTARP
jgi:rhodanese-related sulfurtransferase